MLPIKPPPSRHDPLSLSVGIHRLRPDIPLPTYTTPGAVALDIASADDAVIEPNGIKNLPTGLIIATPPGYALLLAPRSSLFKKKGLRLGNTVGVIDQDFCGPEDELHIQVWNPGTTAVTVTKGERLVQALFVPIPKVEWQEFTPTTGSRGGFGTTSGYADNPT